MPAISADAKDERRQRIMTAALDVIFEKGFAAARMDDVARRAGMSKGAVYLYFPSKEAVFEALIDGVAAPILDHVETVADAQPSAVDALDAMVALVPHIIRETPVTKFMKIIIAEARAFPALAQSYQERIVNRGLAMMERLIARGVAAGDIVSPDPAMTARLFIAPALFAGVWRIAFETDGTETLDIAALLAEHARLFRRALAPEETAP